MVLILQREAYSKTEGPEVYWRKPLRHFRQGRRWRYGGYMNDCKSRPVSHKTQQPLWSRLAAAD
jgi:hypothetical protein